MKVIEAMNWVETALKREEIEEAGLESRFVLSKILGKNGFCLYSLLNKELSTSNLNQLKEMVIRRTNREPVQYIVGECGFLDYMFYIERGVFIPRPETELLVMKARDRLLERNGKIVYDIGTGCGVVALSLARLIPDLLVYASDIIDLKIAYKNRSAFGLEERVKLLSGSLFEPFYGLPEADLIVSNPPYIPTDEIAFLQPEIRDFEPIESIDGGYDGLVFIRNLLSEARKHLKSKGTLMIEIGHGEWEGVVKIAKNFFKDVNLELDYNKKERICICDL